MRFLLVLLIAVVSFTQLPTPASAAARYFVSGGPTATQAFGFRGGWGVGLGMERELAESAALMARADFTSLPSSQIPTRSFYPMAPASPLVVGESGPNAATATLRHVMFGLRLKAASPVRPYLDVMLGVGHLDDPASAPGVLRADTHVALSFGTGIELPRTPLGSPFADVRYDFYFVAGSDTPVVPFRIGLLVP